MGKFAITWALFCWLGLGRGAVSAQAPHSDTSHPIVRLPGEVVDTPLYGAFRDPVYVGEPLPNVLIKAFESQHLLSETPSSIGYVSHSDLQRTQGTSLLPAFNTIPGVRMEERSPDSYRLSIRGSVLAAPFGVMNVRVYWEDMPLTDASGNTYLNVLDMNTLGSAEILKGPAGSMYGAGTGGVVLLHGDTLPQARVQLRGGSYNQWGDDALYSTKSVSLFQSHNQSDGYRVNSASHKDVYQGWGHERLSARDQLDWLGLYTDLYYQTPGGLTLAQMEENPKADRPNSPTIPGASQQKAAIYAQTWFAGLTNHYTISDRWTNTTTFLASGTHFDNPFLTDYEKRREQTFDGLTRWIYAAPGGGPAGVGAASHWRLVLGAEYQYTRSFIHDWGNIGGNPDTTQSNNRLQAFQFNPYAQVERSFGHGWMLQAGVSANTFQYHYLPLAGPDSAAGLQRINFHLQVMPRLSLQYAVLPQALLVYGTLSRGYSPPTIAQIFPGTALLYNNLQPEEGWNMEAGLKSFLLGGHLEMTLTVYDFRLQQSIVPRYDSAGHAYYVNAGGTDQKGVEASADWVVLDHYGGGVSYIRLYASYALQDYHFRDYVEGSANYSGNPLTGVPRNMVTSGVDIRARYGFYLNASYTYTSSIPLNDQDTARAKAYDLVQAKLGWTLPWKMRPRLSVYVGVDNALNQVYSLGDDLNAAGGRYYNPSPGRNFFAGAALRF